MATTIARLAAVLSTDTSQFQAGMQRAGRMTQEFGRQTERSSTIINQLGKRLIVMGGGFGRFGGIAAMLGGAGGPIGLLVASSAALVASLAVIPFKLAAMADAARDADRELASLAEHDLSKAFGRDIDIGFNFRTNAELTKDITSQFKQMAALVGGTLKPALGAMAVSAGVLKAGLFGQRAADAEQVTKHLFRQAVLAKALAKDAEERAKAEQERQRDFIKLLEETAERGRQIQEKRLSRAAELKKEVRTPLEEMRDSFREFDKFMSLGLITPETFGRGIKEAADEFHEASMKLLDAKKHAIGAPGAFEFGTTSEFSARIKGQMETKRLEAIGKEHVSVTRQVVKELQDIKNKPSTTFKVGNL